MVERIFNNTWFKIIVIFVIMTVILFYPVLFKGMMFGSPDSLNPKSVGHIIQKTQEQTGEFPLWQPWTFSGMPTVESFTSISHLYFPYFILKLFFIKGMLAILLHLVFAGIGGYLLLKYLRLSSIAAMLGAAGFMCTPYMVDMVVFSHGSQMMTAAYLPWIFWGLIRLFDRPTPGTAGLLALLVGLQLQRAHVQIVYYAWMLMGAYVLYRLIVGLRRQDERRTTLIATGWFAGAALIGLGISMLIYLPALEYTPYSIRGGGSAGGTGYDYATSWSFHPKEMLTFLNPSAFGFGGQVYWGGMPFTDYPNYMGIIILALAVIGFVKNRRGLHWFLLVTSLLALFTSFGKFFSPLYNLFYNSLPYFNKFRVPAMILILLQFNVAVLAAFGLDAVRKLIGEPLQRWFWWLVGIVGGFALLLLLGEGAVHAWVAGQFTPPRTTDTRMVQAIYNIRWELWYKDAWVAVMFLGAFLGLFWLGAKNKLKSRVVIISLAGLAILDIGIVDYKIIHPGERSGRASQLISKHALDRLFQKDDTIDFLAQPDADPFRIFPAGNLFMNPRFRAFGIESIGGYHPAKLHVYNTFLQQTNNGASLPLMRMLNVRYLVAPQQLNHPELTLRNQGRFRSTQGDVTASIYEIDGYLPRAWFVEQVRVMTKKQQVWSFIKRQDFNPAAEACIVDSVAGQLKFSAGTVKNMEVGIHEITIETGSQQEGFLVVSEVHYPLRWKATIDGKPVPTILTNGVLRGLKVPAGDHLIKFTYDRSVFRRANGITAISLLLVFGLLGWDWYRRRESV